MTIAAGFPCSDGIVLCADTQETYGNLLKINTSKIIAFPPDTSAYPLRLMIAGAGNGPFIDKVASELWKRLIKDTPQTIEEACDSIDQTMKDVHAEFGQIFQQGQVPEIELIISLCVNSQLQLLKCIGPIVNDATPYVTVGLGLYLANYISDRMFAPGVDTSFAEILAIYLIDQAKEYIDGCGGQTHVYTISRDGSIKRMDRMDIVLIGNHMRHLDRCAASVLMSYPDLELSDEQLKHRVEGFMTLAQNLRREQREDRQKFEEFTKKNQ